MPVFDEVVLSLARMNEVLHLDTGAGQGLFKNLCLGVGVGSLCIWYFGLFPIGGSPLYK